MINPKKTQTHGSMAYRFLDHWNWIALAFHRVKFKMFNDVMAFSQAGDHPSLEESIRHNSAHPGHVNDWLVVSIPPNL